VSRTLAFVGGQFLFVGQFQCPRGARLDTGRFLPRLCPLNTKVTLHDRFAVACDIYYSKRAHRQAELAAYAFFFVYQYGVIGLMPMYRACRTNRNAGRILTVPALYRHSELARRLHGDHSLRAGRFGYRRLKHL
jgi:hypothetical protein